MKTAESMTFSVDKENNTIYISRKFHAGLQAVWDAWTKPELLERWYGPKPFRVETISMDFRAGGQWIYALLSEEYGNQWGRTDYLAVVPREHFTASDVFLDEKHAPIPDYPVSNWKIEFSESDGFTVIHHSTTYQNTEDLEKMIEWGFMDGFVAVMKNLDELLDNSKNKD